MISKEAQRNHDALFPNHKSTRKVTDPDLIEIFHNWTRSGSSTKERAEVVKSL